MRDWITHHSWCSRQSWPHLGRDFYSAGTQKRPMSKIVLHSTETTGFPGYANGAANPHFTIDLRTGETRQHVPLSHGARALMIAATREANVAGVIQIEIIGAVTPGYPERYGHYDLVNRLPKDEDAQRYLARLLRAIHEETGIPLQQNLMWVRYPASYGTSGSQRMSVAGYLAYRGVCGHQHVPGNSHGDPGAPPVDSILRLARGDAPAPPVAPDWQTPDHLRRGQTLLAALGYDPGPIDGIRGPLFEAATALFQTDHGGLTVDGSPGPNTLAALEDTMKAILARFDQLESKVDRLPRQTAVATLRITPVGYGEGKGASVADYLIGTNRSAKAAADLNIRGEVRAALTGIDLAGVNADDLADKVVARIATRLNQEV